MCLGRSPLVIARIPPCLRAGRRLAGAKSAARASREKDAASTCAGCAPPSTAPRGRSASSSVVRGLAEIVERGAGVLVERLARRGTGCTRGSSRRLERARALGEKRRRRARIAFAKQ